MRPFLIVQKLWNYCNVLRDDGMSYGDYVEFVDVSETQWYKKIKEKMTPGKYLRIHRENKGLTQVELGEALGGIPRQHISNMENGHRAISIKMARNLSTILGVPIERFLDATE